MLLAIVIAVISLGVILALLASSPSQTVGARVDNLGKVASETKLGRGWQSEASRRSEKSDGTELSDRIVQAGYYRKHAIKVFYALRLLLIVIPILAALVAVRSGLLTMTMGLLMGIGAGAIGTVAPSFLLDHLKARRQTQIRRAMPDALDVIIICVDAGLTMTAALARVAKELRTAHPMLAAEMAICQRQVQMGHSTGEALRRLAQRFDLEEMRSLASVIQQAERYGASIVQAIRVHSDTLREKRFQRAEEKAQRAAVHLVFPTILCIFPALLIVLAGPAVYRIFQMFDVMASS